MTVKPSHLSDDDWARMRVFWDAAQQNGEVAKRLGMSRNTHLDV